MADTQLGRQSYQDAGPSLGRDSRTMKAFSPDREVQSTDWELLWQPFTPRQLEELEAQLVALASRRSLFTVLKQLFVRGKVNQAKELIWLKNSPKNRSLAAASSAKGTALLSWFSILYDGLELTCSFTWHTKFFVHFTNRSNFIRTINTIKNLNCFDLHPLKRQGSFPFFCFHSYTKLCIKTMFS